MADLPADPPPSLGEMFITSVDTLNGTEMDLRVTPGWNDHPPLIVQPGSWRKRDRPEDPALLKAVRNAFLCLKYSNVCATLTY